LLCCSCYFSMRFCTLLIVLYALVPVHARPFHSDVPAPWLKFVRNDNQWEKGVLYRADIPGGFLYVRQNSLQYVFYDSEAVGALHHKGGSPSQPQARAINRQPGAAQAIRAHGFTVTFAGSSPSASVEGVHPSTEKRNYFLGKDPARWASGVPAFGEIIYRNLYPGVHLRLFNHHNSLKYELLVAAGADVSQIRLSYEGTETLLLRNEELIIRTSLNTIRETKPYCYQTIKGQNKEIPSRFVLEDNQLSFHFPKGYQRSHPLVIDPILVFSTFSGSVADNWGHCATYDEQDNLYAGGTVFGAEFPFTNGAFQVNYGENIDVAIMKFNPRGTQLEYATFLGGEQAEVPHSMTVNQLGELLVMGTTSSPNFPTTTQAPFKQFGGGDSVLAIGGIIYRNGSDLFVSKLNVAGSQLLGSTYLGGAQNDGLKSTALNDIRNYGDQFRSEIITDEQNRIYVASVSQSENFPLADPLRRSLQGGMDAVIFRLDASITQLEWSTYFGGDGLDAAYSLRKGKDETLYVCGMTTSTDLPSKSGALHTSNQGKDDGFIARFHNDQLMQVSYVGTTESDQTMLMDLDKDENVYLLGLSLGNYPVSDGTYRNDNSHQFIHALDPTLSQTLFSTVIGTGRNIPDISPTAFLINECGNIYLSGWGGIINANGNVENFDASINTLSTINLPVTPDAFRGTTSGDDFYIMVLETGAQSLLYGTFFGSPTFDRAGAGNHVDGGTSRFNKKGVIFQSTCACGGSGFPTSPGVWSTTNRSNNCNNAAFKFDIESLKASFDVFGNGTKDVIEGCTPFRARFVNTSVGGITYEWDLGGLSTSSQPNEVSYTFQEPGTYEIVLKAFNRLTCKREDVARKTIIVKKADFRVIGNQKICKGGSVELFASGGNQYVWTPAKGLNDPTSDHPVASPDSTTRYKVSISNANGCNSENEVLVEVEENAPADFDIVMSSECGQPMTAQFINNIQGASGFVWNMGNGDTLRADQPEPYVYPRSGTYTVTLNFIYKQCPQTISKELRVIQMEIPANVVTPNGDGKNETFFLAEKGIRPKLGIEGYKLEIYNRWGKSVYQTEDYRNDWGPGVPVGLYYYLLTSPFGTTCKGWIQVLQ